jgi:hypothetical protein
MLDVHEYNEQNDRYEWKHFWNLPFGVLKREPTGRHFTWKGCSHFPKNVEFGQKSLLKRSKKSNNDQKMIQIAACRQIFILCNSWKAISIVSSSFSTFKLELKQSKILFKKFNLGTKSKQFRICFLFTILNNY